MNKSQRIRDILADGPATTHEICSEIGGKPTGLLNVLRNRGEIYATAYMTPKCECCGARSRKSSIWHLRPNTNSTT